MFLKDPAQIKILVETLLKPSRSISAVCIYYINLSKPLLKITQNKGLKDK